MCCHTDQATLSDLRPSTVLRQGKDFAVSFLRFRKTIPGRFYNRQGTRRLSPLAFLFAPRGLPGRALPATILPQKAAGVRTFLPALFCKSAERLSSADRGDYNTKLLKNKSTIHFLFKWFFCIIVLVFNSIFQNFVDSIFEKGLSEPGRRE